jgi:hypothetical protein
MKIRFLFAILGERRFLITALASLLAYLVLYVTAMQYLIFVPGAADSFIAVHVLPHWSELVFRARGPFLFEPIGALHLGPFMLFLSVPNLAIGALLGLLVGANIAVSYYGFRALGMRGVRGMHALVGTVPALVSGAACCVPTLILVIGLQVTATLAAVWPILVPASAALLVVSLWWSLHRIEAERVCEIGARAAKA